MTGKLIIENMNQLTDGIQLPKNVKEVKVTAINFNPVQEKRQVGIDGLSDPSEVDFIVNHVKNTIKPTKELHDQKLEITFTF